MLSFTLDFEDFDALRRLIRDQSGIWLGDSKVVFLKIRLADRLQAMNISSVREYYYFLKYDPLGKQELSRLIDATTVNETWFFRETKPIEAWCEHILPGLIRQGQRLRLCSAGCSTGEEPYTLAMLLNQTFPILPASKIEILALDINQHALAKARTGVYDPHSLRHTKSSWLTQYFKPAPGGRQTVRESIRQLVRFDQANLVAPDLTQHLNGVDLILCRNVLIYFDPESRQTALNNFYEALKPGGHLVLGHSESLAHTLSPFEIARVGGSIIYRKGE